MTGRPGKWPCAHHSVAVTPLMPTIRFASGSYSTIRSTISIGQRCGISASISRVEWIVPWKGVSAIPGAGVGLARVSVIGTSSRSRRRCEERPAPHPVEEVRRHVAVEEGLVPEECLVDLDVRREALDEELVEGRF